MDKIPLELLIKITSYLTCSQKVQLLLVCRYWHSVITNTNLFEHFSVKGKTRFDASMAFFKHKEKYRSQVKSLRLTKPAANLQTILDTPVLFPYLEDFTWADYSNSEYPLDISEEQLKHWQQLKQFEEINRHALSTSLLKMGIFSQLTKIKINFHFGYTRCDELFDHLGNAPKLDRLELSCLTISLETMEKLHHNAPQLNTLYLTDVAQDPRHFDYAYEHVQEELARSGQEDSLVVEERSLRATVPAKELVSLRIRHMKLDNGEFGVESRWLTYISKKYTYLISLIIDGIGITKAQDHYYQERTLAIARACSNLQKYHVSLCPLTQPIFDEMDRSGVKLKELEILDSVNDQLSQLVSSQQKDHIETLKVKSENYEIGFFGLLGRLSKLKCLEIKSNGSSNNSLFVPLDTLLIQVKQLESLTLSVCDVGLELHQEQKNHSFISKIKTLVMDRVLIMNVTPTEEHIDIMGFISKTCPSISKLAVQGQIKNLGHGPLHMHFPGHYFRSIKVYILGNRLYKIDNAEHVAWYQFRGRTLEYSEVIDRDEARPLFENQFHVSLVYKGLAPLNIGGQFI
jgi:hypothetical protein